MSVKQTAQDIYDALRDDYDGVYSERAEDFAEEHNTSRRTVSRKLKAAGLLEDLKEEIRAQKWPVPETQIDDTVANKIFHYAIHPKVLKKAKNITHLYRLIAAEFNLSPSSVIEHLQNSGFDEEIQQAYYNVDRVSFVDKYSAEVITSKALERENKSLQKQLKKYRDLSDFYLPQIQRFVEEHPPIQATPPPLRRTPNDEVYVANLLLSDIHSGSMFTEEDTMGYPAYNLEVMVKRFDRLIEKTLLLCDERSYPIDTLLIDFLGDFVDGSGIFRKQTRYTDPSVFNHVFGVVQQLQRMLTVFSQHFNKVYVRGVPGNHGRFSKEHHDKDNWDYWVYEILNTYISGLENIDFQYYYGGGMAYIIPEIPKLNNMVSHGDSIRSWNGVPYYGINRRIRQWVSFFQTPFDIVKVGHFHTPSELMADEGRCFVNGSWPGTTPHGAKDLAVAGRPTQMLLYFNEVEGYIGNTPIYLADRKEWKYNSHGILE